MRNARLSRRLVGGLTGAAVTAALAVVLPMSAASADAGDPCGPGGTPTRADGATGPVISCTYKTVGSYAFTVPSGVESVDVTVIGAMGGRQMIPRRSSLVLNPGGGAQVTGTLAVASGDQLQLDVAGRGGDNVPPRTSGGMGPGGTSVGPSGGQGGTAGPGGANGDASGGAGGDAPRNGGSGGGGGGSSDIRICATAATLGCGLADRIIVAGGGGGAGGNGGQGNAKGGDGGHGGEVGANAGAGLGGGGQPDGFGRGGTATSGGTGGTTAFTNDAGGADFGFPGALGAGGRGGDGNGKYFDINGGKIGGAAGGGAGGGYYGGGGGGGGGSSFGGGGGAGGGGGGGSSYAAATVTSPVITAGVNTPVLVDEGSDAVVATPDNPEKPLVLATFTGKINEGNGQIVVAWKAPSQTITFPTPEVPVLTGADSALSATATSKLPVTYTSQTPEVCTVTESGQAHAVASGDCTIQATQPGDDIYLAAPPVTQTVTIAKAAQTITFAGHAPIETGKTATLTATATSGLPVSFASSTSAVCTVTSSGELTAVSVGTCTIEATQPGNTSYTAANPVSTNIDITEATIVQQDQTITFTPPAAPVLDGPAVKLSATASSGLPVTYAVSTSSTQRAAATCEIVYGDTVRALAAGSCTITASQPGNAEFNAAPDASVTLTIEKLAQTITLPTPTAPVIGGGDTALAGTASSDLPVTYTSQTPAVCTVTESGQLHAMAAGTCTVTANQPGDTRYAEASPVSVNVTIAAVTTPEQPGTGGTGGTGGSDSGGTGGAGAPTGTSGTPTSTGTVATSPSAKGSMPSKVAAKSGLAVTGSPLIGLGGFAALALLAGGGLVVVARRRA